MINEARNCSVLENILNSIEVKVKRRINELKIELEIDCETKAN